MNHIKKCLLFVFLSFQSVVYSQLPSGSTAPNWTLTDINGNTHTLYDYLDQGKMVVLDFSATWCGPCWNYMMTGALETFWAQHGPGGSNDAMVFFIESDWNTGMDDLLGLTSGTQGNWIANISYPIIDLPPGNNTANLYQINYYPTLYAVCHDASIYELGQVQAQVWSDFVQSCTLDAQLGELEVALCVGEGSVSVEATGGYTPYTYHWNNGANTALITGLNAGNYSVTVTEAHGKMSTLQVYVPGVSSSVSITDVSIESVLCYGASNGSVSIDVEGGTPGYQYDWSNGASTQDLQNVIANNYSLTITDNNGCTIHQSFTVDEPDPIAADIETTPENCDHSDGTITLNLSGGVGNYIVSASSGDVYGDHIINLQAGQVSIEVEDQNGCLWTDEVTIDYISMPELYVTEGAELNCLLSTTTVSGYPSGGSGEFDFHWTTTNGHIISNPLSQTITVDAPGTYLLSILDLTSGCETSNSALVILNIAVPIADAGEALPITCENLQDTLSGSGDVSNQVTWTTPNGHIVEGGNTYHPVVNASGIYYMVVHNPITNCSNQDSVSVSNESAPPSSLFQYQSSGLTINGTDMSSGSNLFGWNWTFGDSTSVSGQANVVHTYTAAGTYLVCLSVQNGCGVSQSCQPVEVTSSGSAILVDALITNVLCFGDRTGSIHITVNGGSGLYNYVWTGADTTFTTSSIDGIPAGEYQLVVSDDLGNIFSGNFIVEQPSAFTIEGSTVVNNLCFGETNGSINLLVSGGVAPYLFSWNGLTPQPENFITQLPAGINQVVAIDANGCELFSDPYIISEPEILQLNSITVMDASGPEQNNGAITLDVIGGVAPYQVLWNTGATGTSISGLLPGEYTYTINDANGCQYAAASPVIVNFTTGITENTLPEHIIISPNPTNGEIVISWSAWPGKNSSLALFSTDGKLIETHIMTTTEGVWDLTSKGLPNGIYIILLKKDKQVFPFKLIVF